MRRLYRMFSRLPLPALPSPDLVLVVFSFLCLCPRVADNQAVEGEKGRPFSSGFSLASLQATNPAFLSEFTSVDSAPEFLWVRPLPPLTSSSSPGPSPVSSSVKCCMPLPCVVRCRNPSFKMREAGQHSRLSLSPSSGRNKAVAGSLGAGSHGPALCIHGLCGARFVSKHFVLRKGHCSWCGVTCWLILAFNRIDQRSQLGLFCFFG